MSEFPTLSQTLLCAGPHKVKVRSVQDLAKSNSVVCRTPQSQTLQCAGPFKVKLCGVQDPVK